MGGGTCAHNGHCQLPPDQVHVQSPAVGTDDFELLVQQLRHNNIPVACHSGEDYDDDNDDDDNDDSNEAETVSLDMATFRH